VHDKEKKYAYTHRKILKLEIPKEIENQKEQILKDLKEAFEGSRGSPFVGFHYKDKYETWTYKIDLEYNGEII
jgi:hypothetical protein